MTARAALAPDPLADLTPETLNETYARLRETAPVHWSRAFGAWVLTRHADGMAVLADSTFLADDPVARFDRLEQRGGPASPNLRTVLSNVAFFTNPPLHTQLRKFMFRLFQGMDVKVMRPALEQQVRAFLRAAKRDGGFELAAGYGNDLALFAIRTLLGLPSEGAAGLAATAREVAWIFDLTPRSMREFRRAEVHAGELLDYFEPRIAASRAGSDEGRFSQLVGRSDSELELSDRELAGLLTFIFSGGLETTAMGIAASALMLLEHDDLRARLIAEPDRIPGAAREFLRLATPFQYVARIASREAEIGGRAIAAGERVNVILGAANRDPAAFPDPDAIDLDRRGPDSLVFGHGAYRCLGAGLAQMETEVAIAAVLANPDLRLAPGSVAWEKQMRVPAMTRAWAEFA
ncbi:MAG: cytochrome P450 [Caulobacteraceae bacterium]